MKMIQNLLVFTAILSGACSEYAEGPDTLDEGAPSGMEDSVASVEQGLSTTSVISGVCPAGRLCVFPAAKQDGWGLGVGLGGCGWYFFGPGLANLVSAIINNQQPGAVSYFYDARGPSPNDDVYIGQSQAFDEIDDLQQRVAADGSNPNDRIDYVHVTQPGCSG